MRNNNVQEAMWDYTVKYVFDERAGVNGIAETTIGKMAQKGHGFELKNGETLEDKCLSVSLLREPPADVKLESVFKGARVFYHICNEKAIHRIYVPQETA